LLNFFKNILFFSLGFLPRIKPVCFIVFVCFIQLVNAQQNLVYNGDFEEYSSCPETVSNPFQNPIEIEKCTGWKAPTRGTSDYFNACSGSPYVSTPINFAGSQTPWSGFGYLGAYFTNWDSGYWWEYVQGKLNTTLDNDKIYKLSLNISVAELSDLVINEFGVYFSDYPVSSEATAALNVSPQCVFHNQNFYKDTANWIRLESYFMANGGECFLTIGNFKDTSNTDTLRFQIFPNNDKPRYTYMYIDDVKLMEFAIQIPNVFTPNGDGVNDFVPFPNFGNSTHKIVLLNRWGNLIYESDYLNASWDGKDATGKECMEGTYFYRINNTNISGFIQLMR
jgi:gliding motility-associated-like protein